MPNTIDERVVEMRFNNSDFEKNVSESMSTIQKLEQKLQFKGVKDGFKNLDDAAKSVNLSPVSNAVEDIKVRISALEVIGITTLTRLTNSAITMGKKIASALTIDSVKTGYQEYETQLNATQTILANTQKEGATIDDINDALDELNRYADLTIYNFTEMTSNIGKFTAAGVDLKTSVSAIQGIANLAAVSGSSSEQASMAMYQLSQALASGTVRLMDWNSVENASMGGQVFQDALKETARTYGIAIDDMIAKSGSFRESLSNDWLSADILTETLKKFTTSGVNEYLEEHTDKSLESIEAMRKEAAASADTTTAFKNMAATLAENSDLTADQIYELLNMSQTAEEAATKVKSLSQMWDVLKEAAQSGWSQTWRTIMGDYEEAKETFTKVSDALTDLINSSANAQNSMLDEWKDFGGRTDLFAGISNAFAALKSVIEPIKEALEDIFPATTGYDLALLTRSFTRFTKTLILTESRMNVLRTIFSTVFRIAKVGVTVVKQLFKVFSSVATIAISVVNALLDFAGVLITGESAASSFEVTLDGIIAVIETVGTVMSGAAQIISKWISNIDLARVKATALSVVVPIFQKIAAALQTVASIAAMVVTAIVGIASSGVIAAMSFLYEKIVLIGQILTYTGGCCEKLETKFGKVGAFIILVIDEIRGGFGKLRDSITELITGDSGINLMETLATKFSEFKEKFVSFVDTVVSKIKEFGIGRALLVAYLGSILYVMLSVTSSIKLVSKSLSVALGGIGGMFTSLTNCIKSITAVSKAPMILKIAAAIAILAGSLALLASMDQEKVKSAAKTLLVVAGAVAAASALMSVLPLALDKILNGFDSVKLTSLGVAMIAMAGSIGIMVLALKAMECIDTNDIAIRLAALGTMLVGLAAFATILSKWAPKFSMTSLTLISFAYGIKSFVNTLSSLSDEQFGTIRRNIIAIGEIMALISVVMVGIGQVRLGSALGILLAAAAIKIICNALNELSISVSGFSSEKAVGIGTGMMLVASAITIVLTALSFFLKNSGINKTIFSIGVSLLATAVAVKVIVAALTDLSKVIDGLADRSFMGAALTQFTVMFGMFALIANKASKVTKDIGISFAAFGIGVLAISKAISILKAVFEDINAGTLAGVIGGITALMAVFSYISALSREAKEGYKSILAMIAALTAIVTICTILSFVPANQLAEMGAIAVGITAIMYGLSKGLAQLGNLKGKSPAASLLSMSAAIVVLVGSLKVLSTIDDVNKLIVSATALGGLILVIGVILNSLGSIDVASASSSLKMMLGVSFTLGALALSLSSIAQSFTQLSAINWQESQGAIVAAIATIGILMVGLLTISNYTDSGMTTAALMLSLAASLLIMSAAIAVVCNGLTAVQNVDWKTIAAIGGIMTALTVAIGVLGIAAGESVLAMAGIAVVAAAMYVMAKAAEVLAPALVIMANALTIAMTAAGQFITVLVSGFNSVAITLSVVFSTITTVIGQFVTTIATAINSIITTISNAVMTFSLAAINFGTALNIVVAGIMQLSTLTLGQGLTIAANILIIGTALTLAFGTAAAAGIVSSVGLIVAALTLLFTTLTVSLGPAIMSLKNVGASIVASISLGITTSTPVIIAASKLLINTAYISMKSRVAIFADIGKWIGQSFATGMINSSGVVSAAAVGLGNVTENSLRDRVDVHSPSDIFMAIGEWISKSFGMGIESEAGEAYSAAQTLGANAYDGADSYTDAIASLGAQQGQAYSFNLKSAISGAIAWAKNAWSSAYNSAIGKAPTVSGEYDSGFNNWSMAQARKAGLTLDEYYKKNGGKNSAYKSYESSKVTNKKEQATLKKQREQEKKQQELLENALGGAGSGGGSSGSGGGGSSGSGGGGSSGATQAAEELKTAVKTVKEEIKDYGDYFNVFSYANEQVTSFHNQYKSTLDTFADVDPIQTSKNAIQLFALNLYKNSGKLEETNKSYQESVNEVLETEMTATERSQKLADLKAEHIKQRTQEIQEVYEEYIATIKDGIQNDIDMLSEFSNDSETTMDTYLDNMQSQIDALNTWEYKMRELAGRDGMTSEIYQYLIDQGFKNGYNLVNELFESSEDQFDEFADKFNRLEGGTLSNLVGDRITNAMIGLQSGLASATTDNADKLTMAMDKSLAALLNEVNPDEELGTKLADSMTSSFKQGLEVIIDETPGYTAPLKESMSSVGACISDGVAVGIQNGTSTVTEATAALGTAAKDAFAESVDAHSPSRDFITKATECIEGLVIGFQNGTEQIRLVMTELGTAAKEAFSAVMQAESWLPTGGSMISYMSEGISKDFVNLKNSIAEAVEKTRIELEQLMHTRFYEIGQYIVQGLIDGLLSKIEELREAAEELAEAMEVEIEDDLDINSPSKVFMRLGQYTGEGFIIGLRSYIGAAADTAGMLSEATITTITDGMNAIAAMTADEMDNPVITPVLDLSEIQNGSRTLNSMFNRRTGIDLTAANANVKAASNDFKTSSRSYDSGSVTQATNQAPTYSFTQNNYSPKALSRIDIYRQTKNQFSALKGLA